MVSDRLTDFPVELRRRLLETLGFRAYSETKCRFAAFSGDIVGKVVATDHANGLRMLTCNQNNIHFR